MCQTQKDNAHTFSVSGPFFYVTKFVLHFAQQIKHHFHYKFWSDLKQIESRQNYVNARKFNTPTTIYCVHMKGKPFHHPRATAPWTHGRVFFCTTGRWAQIVTMLDSIEVSKASKRWPPQTSGKRPVLFFSCRCANCPLQCLQARCQACPDISGVV